MVFKVLKDLCNPKLVFLFIALLSASAAKLFFNLTMDWFFVSLFFLFILLKDNFLGSLFFYSATLLGLITLVFSFSLLPAPISFFLLIIAISFNTYYGFLKIEFFPISLLFNLLALLLYLNGANFFETLNINLQLIFAFFCYFVYQLFFNPKNRILKNLTYNSFQELNRLNDIVFTCLLTKDYIENKYLYENKKHDAIFGFLETLNLLSQQLKNEKKKTPYLSIMMHLELIFEALLAINLIVYRIQDHTTFEVIHKELYAISIDIARYFETFSEMLSNKNINISEGRILESISQIEEAYRNALQVVVYDPKNFIFFIKDLYALHDNLMKTNFYLKKIR